MLIRYVMFWYIGTVLIRLAVLCRLQCINVEGDIACFWCVIYMLLPFSSVLPACCSALCRPHLQARLNSRP